MDSTPGNKVLIFIDDWSYANSYKNFTNPANMITIESSLFMAGGSYVCKLDKDLKILIQYDEREMNDYERV